MKGVTSAKSRDNDEIVELYDSTTNRVYYRHKFLGKGGFAKCYECKDCNGNTFACKIVPKSLLTKAAAKDKMASEISIHRSVSHVNVVKFISYFEDNENVYVLLEICRSKSMMELHKRRRILTDPEVRYYFRQIIFGCGYLHQQKIIHRDLKLGNLFLDDDLIVKIGDFGLAAKIEFPGERKKTLCGTPNYIAPEVLSKRGHSFEVDVWSAGCILYTLYVGKPPFETSSLTDTYSKIKKNEYTIPAKVPRNAQNLIIKMLQRDPVSRPSMQQVLDDPYFSEGLLPTSLPLSSLAVAPRFSMEPQTEVARMKDINPKQGGMKTHVPMANILNQIHNVPAFFSQRSIPVKWFPSIPVANVLRAPVDRRGAHAIKVQDGTMTSFEEEPDAENLGNEPADCYLSDLINMLMKLVTLNLDSFQVIQMEEAEDPKSTPLYWISKWVDYSEKYGLGYELSDNSLGVFFNDTTHLMKFGGRNDLATYITSDGKEFPIEINAPTAALSKKTSIFNNFCLYMERNLISTGADVKIQRCADVARLPFVRLWIRNDDVIIFQLTCGILQANFFKDHTKLLMCPRIGAVTFINENRQFKTYPFHLLERFGCSPAVMHRIRYVLVVTRKVLSVINAACGM